MDGILESLCTFAREVQAGTLSREQRDSAKLRVIDTIACGVGGSFQPPVEAACRTLLKIGGTGPCTVLGHGNAPVDRATLLNGYMMRFLDCNDSYHGVNNSSHPSDVISAALAVGEAEHRSGEEVLKAIVAGYEVYAAFTDAVAHQGWDIIFIGAAVAVEAAILLGLSGTELANAISLATVSQTMLRQTRTGALSQWKGCAAGDAAAHAVLVTYLAAGGMTGPGLPFEGRWGAIAQVSGPLTVTLDPKRDRTREIETKLYPVGQHALGPVELGLELRPRLGTFAVGQGDEIAGLVDDIEIRAPDDAVEKMADPAKWTPTSHETADHSMPFLFSLALAYGYVDYDAIDRGLHDPSVLDLTRKVRVVEDPEMSRKYRPAFATGLPAAAHLSALKPTHVRITGSRGVIEAGVEAPLGHYKRPAGLERITAKLHEYADPVLGLERAARLEQRLLGFEQLTDVVSLLDV